MVLESEPVEIQIVYTLGPLADAIYTKGGFGPIQPKDARGTGLNFLDADILDAVAEDDPDLPPGFGFTITGISFLVFDSFRSGGAEIGRQVSQMNFDTMRHLAEHRIPSLVSGGFLDQFEGQVIPVEIEPPLGLVVGRTPGERASAGFLEEIGFAVGRRGWEGLVPFDFGPFQRVGQ